MSRLPHQHHRLDTELGQCRAVAFVKRQIKQDIAVGRHGQPGIFFQFAFQLPRIPTGAAYGQNRLADGIVFRQPFDDVARRGQRGIGIDGDAALPLPAGRMDDEAAVYLHRPAHHYEAAAELFGHGLVDGGKYRIHRYRRRFVDDQPQSAVPVVAAHIDHAAAEKRVFQRGRGNQEMVGQIIHGLIVPFRWAAIFRPQGEIASPAGKCFQTARYDKIAPFFFNAAGGAVWQAV